ncbi:MAG: S-layer homology domain-containing protein, partial [Clostridia bacterium]|nr:S-layer homology domain-containing protein [Clostridia bacterium]
MLKKILSLVIVFSITLATGIGVYGTETEFTLPVSGEYSAPGNTEDGSVSGIGSVPKSDYTPDATAQNQGAKSGINPMMTQDNSTPIVEENATKHNKMMNRELSSSVAPSKYEKSRVALSPDISGTKYEEAAEVLGALGIMVGDAGTGQFRPSDNIKRSEMAKVAVYASGFEDVAINTAGPTRFPDVAPTHWANGAITIAEQQGMVIGDQNGNFRPDDPVSLQEAVTIMVRSMGYEPVASNNGGFPGGYMYVASSNQLLKGVTTGATAPATRGDIAQLVFNCLTVNLMEQTNFGTNTRYEVVDKTLLYDRLNVEKGYGQIRGTSETTLNGGSTLSEDRIQINDEIFIEGTASAKQLLGHNVVYYARIDATSDEKTVIVVRSQASKNNTLTLTSEEIDNATGTVSEGITIEYTKENMSNSRTAKTVINPVFIYNGKYDTQITAENLEISSGNLVLLDTDVNNIYDIIFINEFTNIVVDTVSTVTGRVTDKYNGTSIVLDPDEEEVQYTLLKDGQEIEPKDLQEWNVISYTTSRDRTLIRGYVSTESIVGTVTQISSDGGIRFNNETTSYMIAESYPNEINVRDSGRFYLDYEGKIAAVDPTETTGTVATETYGYLVGAAETGVFDTDVQFKIFTQAGETRIFNAASRVRLNGTYGLTPSEVLTSLTDGGSLTPQLITFRTNADNNITSINTAFDNTSTGAPNTDKFTLNIARDDVVYRAASSKLGDITVDENTIIFDIPETAGTDTDKYAVRTKAMFANDGTYDVLIYDLMENYTARAVVVTSSTGVTAADAPIVLVDELAEAQNEDYENIDVLYGLSG